MGQVCFEGSFWKIIKGVKYIGFALKEAQAMAKSNPKCLYRGVKLTRRLIKEILKDAEDSVNGD